MIEMEEKDMEIECSIDFNSIMNGAYGELTIGDNIYILGRLDRNIRGNKGGNSWVMKMFQQDSDPENDPPAKIIKINKSNYFTDDGKIDRRNNKRIDGEIAALNSCKAQSAKYVISIDSDGVLKNTLRKDGKIVSASYRFYTMEVAEFDLKQYMEKFQSDMDFIGRINVCKELTKALNELYLNGYYHRDIKPDNFFFIEDEGWKVGDLGLSQNRKTDKIIDGKYEFVGPKGWTSPETMNKHIVKEGDKRYDRIIDEKSDIFQLGMVFWYVMQGNAPIGCIMEKDFHYANHSLYILIRLMVSHDKSYRPKDFQSIIDRLDQIIDRELF